MNKPCRILLLLRQLEAELANYLPENANGTFIMAIHSVRVSIKALKVFF